MSDDAKVIIVMCGLMTIFGGGAWFVCSAIQQAMQDRRSRIFSAQFRTEWNQRRSRWPTATPASVAWASLIDTIPTGTADEVFDALMVYVKRTGQEVSEKMWPGLLCNAIVRARNQQKAKEK